MQDFRKLRVWEKAHSQALDVYKETAEFPPEERFGLTSQLRRAAVSVPANISEGCGRGSGSDVARFFQIAMGSASELEYLLLLAHELGLLSDASYERLSTMVVLVKRMLSGLTRKARASRRRWRAATETG